MALVQIMGTDEGLGDGEVWPTILKPTAPAAPATSGGFFGNILGAIGKAGNWFQQNSTGLTQVLNAAGQLKAGTKAQAQQVDTAWDRNIRQTPPYQDPSWIPGIPNGAVIAGGVALGLVLFLVMKKKDQ